MGKQYIRPRKQDKNNRIMLLFFYVNSDEIVI